MRGKVDFTRILDLLFNPTPVNDAMGEVFIISSMLAQSRLVHAQSQWTNLRSALSSIIHPFYPVPESHPLLRLALFLKKSLKFHR